MFTPAIHHFETLVSTNDEAKELIRNGTALEGTVIWADKQTRGRGRMGRRWISDAGNLYASLVVRPGRTLIDIAQLSFLTSISIGEILIPLIGKNGTVSYKWPNDVLVEGQKICGILLETESDPHDPEHPIVVIGFGLNLTRAPEFVSFPPTRLQDFVNPLPTIEELLYKILDEFSQLYNKWYYYGFDPIREMWLERAHGLEELITVIVHNQPLVARFDGIDNNGSLLCTDEIGRLHTLSSTEVFFM